MQTHSFESVINQMPGLFFLKDKDSHYIGASQHFQRFCQFTGNNSIIGNTDYDTSWANHANTYRDADNRVINNGESISFLEPLRIQNNKDLLVVSRKSPFYNENQDIIGLTCRLTIVSSSQFINEFTFLTQNDFELLSLTKDQAIQYSITDHFSHFNLSKQEAICLFYLVRGQTAKQIATVLQRSMRTIEKHIISIKHKLNCNAKCDIIAKAIEYGFVQLIPSSFMTDHIV